MADLVSITGRDAASRRLPAFFLRPGTGEWKVNGKAFEEYFVTEQQRVAAKRTLVVVELASTFDVITTVSSGGVAAQADAVKMGRGPCADPVQSRVEEGAQDRRSADP